MKMKKTLCTLLRCACACLVLAQAATLDAAASPQTARPQSTSPQPARPQPAPATKAAPAAQPAAQPAPAARPAARPAPATQAAGAAPAPTPQRIVSQGVEIEFSVEPLAPASSAASSAVSSAATASGAASASGTAPAAATPLMEEQDARLRFRVTDTATHTPLSGVRPSAWISRREGTTPPTQEMCKEKVRSFLQGSLRSRPDVDLNAYYLLALNSEPNISVIDPLLGFGGTKLVTLVFLRSPGEDWAMSADQSRLFVSMPASNRVAVVDTATWRVTAEVETGERPVRLALQPDGKYLWVGTDGAGGGVTVIDTAALKAVARLAAGAGHREVAVSADSRTAYVAGSESGTLSIIDIKSLSKRAEVKVGRTAASVTLSPLSRLAYVSDTAAGRVAVVDGGAGRLVAQVAVGAGVGAVRFAPGGRYGFAPNALAGVVYIFDVSTNRLLHTLKVAGAPDQVAFTREFAYVRAAASKDVTMIRLSTVGQEPDVLHFPAGQSAPADSATGAAVAASLSPAPEPNSMLVANVADRQIYYYTEGMAAPMGTFQNYKREPRAVMVADRSLREVVTGSYETVTRLPRGGEYDVAFLLDTPQVTHCFEARAAENPAVAHEREAALKVEYLGGEGAGAVRAGEEYRLRFRLVETATGAAAEGLRDVRVLTFLSPGVWQKREWAQEVGGGVYELRIRLPQAGLYMVFVESRAKGVEFRQMPYLTVKVEAAAEAKAEAARP